MQVRFIQTDTTGVSNARNIGLDCPQGEFVTFRMIIMFLQRIWKGCVRFNLRIL